MASNEYRTIDRGFEIAGPLGKILSGDGRRAVKDLLTFILQCEEISWSHLTTGQEYNANKIIVRNQQAPLINKNTEDVVDTLM